MSQTYLFLTTLAVIDSPTLVILAQKPEFKKRQKRNAAHRRWYRKTHPKKYKGKTRGRKPARKNEKFRPTVLSTGDTLVELLTRCRCALTQTPDKWSERTKERMDKGIL